MDYEVKLEIFEGPLDLLLHLIQKNEVDIFDIPIATITDQYLEYLEWMKALNIDLVGDFLVMASTLIHIKSRMLLPGPQGQDEEDLLEEIRAAPFGIYALSGGCRGSLGKAFPRPGCLCQAFRGF